MSNAKKHDGISLRTIHTVLIILGVLISALMVYFTFRLSTEFRQVTDASELQIELR